MPVYKDKERKTWFYRGAYIDSLTGKKRYYKKRGFVKKDDAKKAEYNFLLSKRSSSHSHTLDDMFNEMCSYQKNRIREDTITNDKKKYRSHIKPYFGNKKMTDIQVREIILWQEKLSEKGYSYNYIDNIYNALSKTYTYAYRVYGLEYNPIKRAGRLKKPDEIKKEMLTYDFKTFSRFISYVDELVYEVLFTMLYMTGMRRGELLALQWKDLKNDFITINKSCKQAKGGFTIGPPKTKNSYRTIKLDKNTTKLLKRYRKHKEKTVDYSQEFYIFGDYRPISFTTLKRKQTEYMKKAEVPIIRTHDFRHSHASLLINNKMPLPAIAARLGDTITTVLETYAHLFEESNTEVSEFLDSLDKKLPKSCPKQHIN
ncbi:site-specific integrase [Breznakia sp. OttesenSCG-928-G09]|nr:site-specific integrase [Breznakia sp. OttesenSCG-928-G09]